MRFLFVADPVERLKPLGDSSLAMLREVLRRGHEAFWALGEDVEYSGQVAAWAWRVISCAEDAPPQLGERARHPLAALDAVLIRKDPPFDAGYVRLCWLLQLAEGRVFFLNRPSLLLRYHEKLVPLEAYAQGFLSKEDIIPTHIGKLERAKEYVREAKLEKVITKPFLGFGGREIALFGRDAFLALEGGEEGKGGEEEELIVQPFRAEVAREGDRRVFFLDGKMLAQFVRMPKEGGFISNLAQGGTALLAPLSPRQVAVLERLGAFLKSAGLVLAGADLIGERISEVNVTSPTGLKNLQKLEGVDYSRDIIDLVESRAK